MKLTSKSTQLTALVTGLMSLSLVAQAQDAEDSSAEFNEANAAMEASLGMPPAETSLTYHPNGMISARVGLESMKMLVARVNEDGTVSYAHASTEEEAQEFVDSKSSTKQEEK